MKKINLEKNQLSNTHEPLVSIIIPCFNRYEATLRAIKSVVVQTYKKIEIIVVDDFSSGDIIDYLRKRVPKNCKIKYIRNKINLGPGQSRNVGILKSKGTFICLLDNDDQWIDSKKIKIQLDAFQKLGDKYLLVGSFVQVAGGRSTDNFSIASSDAEFRKTCLQSYPIQTSSWMLRRSVFDDFGIHFNYGIAEDYSFLLKVGSVGKVFSVPTPTVAYNISESSLHLQKTFSSAIIALVNVLKYKSIYPGYKKAILLRIVRPIKRLILGR